ncbi:MAG: 3-phosphoshikimate 1-carboxyvinyltransferase [Candidatus Scalindua sp.]|nr:3-phosphoshikimate 1-carboxyvinyltransferase [Candidatus Scalindua sp.]
MNICKEEFVVDILEIKPTGRIRASVLVPGSKSYTNRALITALLAAGPSVIKNPLLSDDTRFMIAGLNTIGVSVKSVPEDNSLLVNGCSGKVPAREANIYAGNAGTVVRFMTAALTLGNGRYEIDGVERMRNRPIQELLDSLNQLGANVVSKDNTGCPPVVIHAHGLKGGTVRMKGDVSSQYVSAILLAAPYATNDVRLVITEDLVSKNYVDMTIDVMRKFGVTVRQDAYREFFIESGQCYKGCGYIVEPDASNASYFLAAAAITGGKVKIEGLGTNSLQGDAAFADILSRMGCTVKKSDDWMEIEGGELKGIDIDMNDTPDVVQTLAVVAVFAKGKTHIRNVKNLRYKETDRIKALVTELQKIGVNVIEYDDGLEIEPAAPHAARIATYDDHRMAMSFALIGLRSEGITLENPDCVAKTFPDYFEKLQSICNETP